MSSTQEQILESLREYRALWPEMRFGQAVLAVAQSARGPVVEAPYDVEDEEFLAACRRLIALSKARPGRQARSDALQ